MINVFSRDAMINHITLHGVQPDEYYISILSTGGPKGVPIFKEGYPNVITLVFDDVVVDCIKTKYPDGEGLRYARAMTPAQADTLCNFIKTIPNNATINVHCVQGESRSVGVALAIENKQIKTMGNRHVHKLVMERLYK
jgi:predicted protein tyrosine phosphatase